MALEIKPRAIHGVAGIDMPLKKQSGPRAGQGGPDANARLASTTRDSPRPNRAQGFAYVIPRTGDKRRAHTVIAFLDLPDCAKRVAHCLVDRCNGDTGQCDPTGERLQHDCRLSHGATWKGIKALERAGLIRRVQGGGARRHSFITWPRNSYEINWQGFNALHADLDEHRGAYRVRSKTKQNEATPLATIVDETPCTPVDETPSTPADANLKRPTLENTNLKTASGARGDVCPLGITDDDDGDWDEQVREWDRTDSKEYQAP